MTPGDSHGGTTDTAIAVSGKVVRATAGLVPGGPDWARAMDGLAEELLHADWSADADGPADHAGSPLDAAISVRRLAIERLDDALAATVGLDLRNNLAVDLASRYQAGGGLDDLLESCALSREVLAGAARGDLLTAAAGLAGRLSLLARNPGHEAELDQAIRLLAGILKQARHDDDLGRPIVVTSLAGLELHRWQRDGDPAALAAAATAAAMAWRTGEVTGATLSAVNVAALLLEHAEQAHDTGVLNAGETLLRAVIRDGSPRDAVAARGSLAVALVTRFDLEGGEGLLAEAIDQACAAIAVRPPGPSRAEDLSTRAAARAALARLRGDPELLDAAIADARAAVAEPATHAADPSGPVNSLAMLLAERYDLLGDSVNLDESITLHEGLLTDPAVAVDGRPAILSNLANGLLSRFERDRTARARSARARALADIRRAADLAEEAIGRTPPSSIHLAARHDTAGRVRAALGYHLGSAGTPGTDGAAGQGELAERHARAAAGATPQGSPDRAHYLNNWAMWVTDRWERTADPAALAQAIGLLEEARAAVQGDGQLRATITFNLGVRMQERFELSHDKGEPNWDDLQGACDLLDDVLAAGLPHLTVPAGKRLGDIAVSLAMWPEAEHALRLALAAAGDLTGLRPLQPDKQRARSGVQGIGALAALCAARAGNTAAAALHLEQASATLLAESLGVRADTVTFAGITTACRVMRRSILFLGSTPAGGLAVLADENGACQAIELPGLTDDAVQSATSAFRRQLAAAIQSPEAGHTAGEDPLVACHAAGDQLTRWTWTAALAPLGELLAGSGRLAILPLGRLAWLPITAAGPPGRPPALASHEPVLLIRAAAVPAASGVAGDSTAARAQAGEASGGQGLRVLIWADTGPGDRVIPSVLDEARRVADLYPGARTRLHDRQDHDGSPVPLRGSVAGAPASDQVEAGKRGAADLADLLGSADIVHLACHCDIDPGYPEDTVLQVDPPVRMGDVGVGVLHARTHIVLSACDAALTATSLPDEALSPAAAFLLAGAGTVTAPVWPVDDEAAGGFMVDYHRRLSVGTEPGQALSQVQAAWSASRPRFDYAPWVVVLRPQGTAAS
ncbi:MAG: CHAT domain-containing protein [Streptosporangiaceae bacterium]